MDKDELWSRALSILLTDIEDDNPKSVFLHLLTPFEALGDYFGLFAESSQVEDWVNKNYIGDIKAALEQVSGTKFNVRVYSKTAFGVAATQAQSNPNEGQHQPTEPQIPIWEPAATEATEQDNTPDWMNTYVNPEDIAPQPQQTAPQKTTLHNALNSEERELRERCTFETFVVGQSNEFARGAALAVAEQPGIAYNPLFIYGKSGLGKTHLLLSIANYINRNMPYLSTLYVPADTFITDFIDALKVNNMPAFNSKYGNVDVLLIDDVQRLEGRETTADALFKLFNEMTSNNKQIVLSADRSPKEIDLDERYRSRFVQGLLADIKPPDYETRLAIIKNLIAREEERSPFYAVIPEDIQSWLAEIRVPTVRDIQGAITRLVGHMSLRKRTSITLDEAKDILQDFFPDRANRQISISLIQKEVERYFDVSHEDLISSKRSKILTYPRHIAIYLCRFMTEESLADIGKKFGGRDHTTVMYSVYKIENEQKDNRILYDQLEQLRTRINERS